MNTNQINCIIIMFYISLGYQDRLYATEVTIYTAQNHHLFLTVISDNKYYC